MNFSNPFTSKTGGKENPFLTGKSCLQSTAPVLRSSNLSAFAAFDKPSIAMEPRKKETTVSALSIHEGDASPSSSDTQGSSDESHGEEYFSANDLYNSQESPEAIDLPSKKGKEFASTKGFSNVRKEMDQLVDEVAASFRRLKTITAAVCARSAAAPGEASATSKQSFPVHNHFYYGKSEISPRDVGEVLSGDRVLGTHSAVTTKTDVTQGSAQTSEAATHSKVPTAPSVAVSKPEERGGDVTATPAEKKATECSSEKKIDLPNSKSTGFSGDSKSSPFDFATKPNSELSSLASGALSATNTAEGNNSIVASGAEGYPFTSSVAGSWKCWRCTKAISTDELMTKLKELNASDTNVEGQSYFLVKCDDPKCMGCKRRYFFIPNGKDPVLHKDVPKTNAQQAQPPVNFLPQKPDTTTNFASSSSSSPFASNSQSQPMMPPITTLPSKPENSFANTSNIPPFPVTENNFLTSEKSNASKEEANSFFMQNKPQETVQQSANPFLAARESFSAQPQSSGSQPQFGVRSAITSSFAPQQPAQTSSAASSGTVFGNSRFQNFSNNTSWGSANNTSLWGQPSGSATFGHNPSTSNNPNAPLNPFQQQSSFNHTG